VLFNLKINKMKTITNQFAKVVFIGIVAIATSLNAVAQRTWIHPGGNNSKADLDYVKSKIALAEQPWYGKYLEVRAVANAGGITTPAPTSEGGQKNDGRTAYAAALVWYYTGDVSFANKAIGILNSWGNSFTGYSPVDGQNLLQGGWIGALLGPAAEIMRGYSGWASADMIRVQNMFKTSFYPVLNKMSTWNGNVDLTQIDAMMNIAVFCEDETEFNLGLQRLKSRNPAYFYLSTDSPASRNYGSITTGNWTASNFVDGLMQESCRDFGHHAQYAMASGLHAAEVAWNQGVDVYGDNTTRYVATLELLAGQLLSGSMGGVCSSGNTAASNDLYDTWEIGYNHYHNRMGMTLPNTEKLITTKIRSTGASDWNIFFETLTHANLPLGVKPCGTAAPTVASTSIDYTIGDLASTLSATGTALKWYTASYGGTALAGAPTPNTAVAGTTTYYVSQTLADCESPRVGITVNVVNMFIIPRTNTAPVIDGVLDNVWNSNNYSQSFTKSIVGTISNQNDLSGTFKALWDNTYLYVLGDVTDDVKMNDSPEPYFDDAIELYLDINNNKPTTYAANDLAYTFGWNDGTTVTTTPAGRSIANVTYSMVAKTGGYVFEARIPWSTLQGNPAVGQLLGLDFHVNDDDNGGGRDGKLSWNAATDDAWQNPSLFGTAKLGDLPAITSIEGVEVSNTMYFPNPFTDILNIKTKGDYTIYSMFGNVLEQGNCDGTCEVGHALNTGIYLLEINEGAQIRRVKVVKK